MSDTSLTAYAGPVLGSPDAERAPEERRGLHYPHGRWVPGPGALFEVAPGVHWLRMPLPMGGLDHINLWALEDGDGWVLVDTGLSDDVTRGLWAQLFEDGLGGRPVRRVIVTHFHPDHIGLAGWLCARWGVPLEMARTEYLLARMLALDIRPEPPGEAIDFSVRAGWPDTAIQALRSQPWGRYGKIVSALPAGFRRLRGGEVLSIGGREWRLVTGRGHSPEHLCLVTDGLMISGDQVLPRITSNVSVYPTEPYADPLGDWLESIEALRAIDPDVLVLPAHNEPFRGLHVRLDQLAADHHDKLAKLHALCAVPRTAFESFSTLFRKPIGERDYGIATGEAVAHLHWLEARGRLRRLSDDSGVDRFEAI
ncbi:MBL fold metallo-hydrolase [Polymorphobacter sp.]|uniref:MBL fold metallo-hydrolase n=1 Tax=Polymorphobacter sp. TaxID=1909290 RepID=UPI003F6EAF45